MCVILIITPQASVDQSDGRILSTKPFRNNGTARLSTWSMPYHKPLFHGGTAVQWYCTAMHSRDRIPAMLIHLAEFPLTRIVSNGFTEDRELNC